MKSKYLFAATAAAITATSGYAYTPLMFANGMTARNIGAIQHSVMIGAIENFEGSAASALGPRGRIPLNLNAEEVPTRADYGEMARYGTMPMYGEYGDDGTVLRRGRNGGDNDENTHRRRTRRPKMNNIWLAWEHYGDDAKYSNMQTTDSPYDLIMFGLSVQRAQLQGGVSEWGMFGGYVGGTQENDYMEIHENGGYVGIYNGYNIREFYLSFAADAGALYNRAEAKNTASDEFANLWIGASINTKYNIRLTDEFTLQPGAYIGYTWIKSANYISVAGAMLDNNNFNMFEISPALRAIQHIGRGWYGTLGARYAFNLKSSGKAYANNVQLPDLDTKDFVEYGVGVEKSIDRFNIAVNLGRHDGGRRGWNGGFSLKYIF